MGLIDRLRGGRRSTTPLERVLAAAPSIRLDGPAPAGALAAVEADTGLHLPRAVHELFALHDGDLAGSAGLMLGLQLLPVGQAIDEWRTWQLPEVAELYEAAQSVPPGVIREVGISPGWFPLGHDGSGNYIGLDLDPGPAGVSGQIIGYGADEDEHHRYARDLDAFFTRTAELLEGGGAIIDGSGWRFPASRNSWAPVDLFA